jgi:PilZ domain
MMEEVDLHQEYAKILEEGRRRGDLLAEQEGKERRTHPRLAVKAADLWISSVPEYSLVDLSVSGLAIMANYPLDPGQVITMTLGTAMTLEAEVINCQLVESPTDYSDAVFRIQCRFEEELQGMELVVQVKKREYQN